MDTGIKAFVEREEHCHYTILYYTKNMISKCISTQAIVKTENVKEGTGSLVDTTTAKMDVTEEKTDNTFPLIKDMKKYTNSMK